MIVKVISLVNKKVCVTEIGVEIKAIIMMVMIAFNIMKGVLYGYE
jgi:hypothetical protein